MDGISIALEIARALLCAQILEQNCICVQGLQENCVIEQKIVLPWEPDKTFEEVCVL